MSWGWPQWFIILWIAASSLEHQVKASVKLGVFWATLGVISVHGFLLWVLWMGGFFGR